MGRINRTPVVNVRQETFTFALEAIRLRLDGLFERQVLESFALGVLVMRVGAIDRVSEERDQLNPGQCLPDTFRNGRMEDIIRARLARQHNTPGQLNGKVLSVPLQTFRIAAVK